MKKLVLVAVLVLGFSIMAMAQDTPAVEVYGGYAYLRANPPADIDSDSINMNGWNASVAFNANRWVGLVAGVNGYYKTVDTGVDGDTAKLKVHTVMFGPRLTLRSGKITPFVQGLIGVAHVSTDGFFLSENDLVLSLGGGIDINLNHRIAVRPVQMDYVGLRFGQTGDFLNNFQYSAGIVFKLGKR